MPAKPRISEQTPLGTATILDADEVFSTGSYGKMLPITKVEDRHYQMGHVYQKARSLYFEFAKTQPIG